MTTVITAAEHLPVFSPRKDDDPLYEILDGQRVELPPMSTLATRVASNLHMYLGHYLVSNRIGEAVVDGLFRLPLPKERNRRPDVAFISADTIAQAPNPGSDNAWAVVPELMVEVVSPHDYGEEIIERIDEYFTAGTKLVWIVYPTWRLVYVYESPYGVRILRETDHLEGGVVLPAFRLPIVSLFPTTPRC
jgi:Uma2 family endonuclease